MFGWFNKEINSLDDIKGLKMRFPGFGGEVFKRAGGIPVNIPGGELYTAMQTGTIDAVEWVGPYNDLAFGFQQVAKYYYYPGWHEPGSMLEFTINIDAWDTLPPHLQAIVTTAAKAVNQDLLDEYTASNNRALQDLIENHDVQLRELPKDVINEFRIISEEILETSAANDPDVKKVYDSFKTFLAEVKGFHAIAEDAFVEARTNSDGDS
jgi:TRAP-type mannitol/chloroaromatic compound transport system substrate-binding protein